MENNNKERKWQPFTATSRKEKCIHCNKETPCFFYIIIRSLSVILPKYFCDDACVEAHKKSVQDW
jgi:hypothetical protein